jgi:hypothetical protein
LEKEKEVNMQFNFERLLELDWRMYSDSKYCVKYNECVISIEKYSFTDNFQRSTRYIFKSPFNIFNKIENTKNPVKTLFLMIELKVKNSIPIQKNKINDEKLESDFMKEFFID